MTSRRRAPALKRILGQPSWRIRNDAVEAYVTETGGHVGPVRFTLGRRVVEPLSVAPWAEEKLDPKTLPLIRALRGDFFCLPFGGNAGPFRDERHPVHGETANAKWRFESLEEDEGRASLHLSLRTRIRAGRLDKHLSLVEGHRAVYQRHVVSRMTGPMAFGHHAMIRFPAESGSGAISSSPFVHGQVFPGAFENPEDGGYTSLRPGAEFTSLAAVPTSTGGTADLTRYPARRGFEDLVLIASDPALDIAWTAVTFPKPRFVWFALKDPRVLRSTVLWISNGGRHYAPWSGRHVDVVGLEEVTSNFHYGLAESAAPNDLSRRGIATMMELDPTRPLVVSYVMAVAAIPKGFDRVARIVPEAGDRSVAIVSDSGLTVRAPLDVGFVRHSGVPAETTGGATVAN